MPQDIDESAAEIIPGRMECGEDGPTFVPGLSMELHGVKTFIPGKVQKNDDGSETFVPGKEIHTKNGLKFVSGQVIQAEDGDKFLPGVVMDLGPEKGGKIFVPAMEVQTKSGPMLIPGQVTTFFAFFCRDVLWRKSCFCLPADKTKCFARKLCKVFFCGGNRGENDSLTNAMQHDDFRTYITL